MGLTPVWKMLHSVDYMCAAVSRNGPVSIYMDWLNNVSKVSAFDADLGHIKFEARQICAEKKVHMPLCICPI